MARAAVARAAALKGGAPDRYACGKLKPTHPPATIKRVIEGALKRSENPLLGTPIGWLLLHNEISTKQASAAGEYASLRTAFDRAMGLPRRRAQILGLCDWRSHWTDEDARAACARFDALREKLLGLGPNGRRIISILDDACVDLQMPAWADQILLRAGLDRIAEHFRIGDGKLAA